MGDKCMRCKVGMIGGKYILAGEWDTATKDFDNLIDEWNEKTKRFAIPHPGFANKFIHCPSCGFKVEG